LLEEDRYEILGKNIENWLNYSKSLQYSTKRQYLLAPYPSNLYLIAINLHYCDNH
jgi:hypothetical protein